MPNNRVVAPKDQNMSISLYYLRGSPYAWRVQLALEHKGIDHEIKTVDMGGGETRHEQAG